MMLCNETSRYHIAAAAVRAGALFNPRVSTVAHEAASSLLHRVSKDKEYIYANGRGKSCLCSWTIIHQVTGIRS